MIRDCLRFFGVLTIVSLFGCVNANNAYVRDAKKQELTIKSEKKYLSGKWIEIPDTKFITSWNNNLYYDQSSLILVNPSEITFYGFIDKLPPPQKYRSVSTIIGPYKVGIDCRVNQYSFSAPFIDVNGWVDELGRWDKIPKGSKFDEWCKIGLVATSGKINFPELLVSSKTPVLTLDQDRQDASNSKLDRDQKKLENDRRQFEERERLAYEKVKPMLQTTAPIVPASSSIFTGKRLALVIGNTLYKNRPLTNPRNDADDVSRSLKNNGFEVIDLRDATLAQMRASVRLFGEKLINNDVGLVYYSGHGIEVKGKNYFIPVNADIKASDEVADQAMDVSLILGKMDSAKKGVNILIVDACRDDPFGRSYRSNSRGLAAMDAPQGTIIAYATSPGTVAADGAGRNSPYTKNLVKAMHTPNLPIELMFKEVRRAVREETKNQQTPWENTSLSGDFYFSVKK